MANDSSITRQENGSGPSIAAAPTSTQNLSKRDKRRQQIGSRLGKLEITFNGERDNFYRALLHDLQTALATLQQGTNEDFKRRKELLEEQRDYELTRLRLWEEYQVKRIESEYNQDILKANENHEKMIKLIKEKLYDKLQTQVKQLKDDKLLLNLVNANSWKGFKGNPGAPLTSSQVGLAQHERRSLRKREASLRLAGGLDADDLSDSGFSDHRSNGLNHNGSQGNGSGNNSNTNGYYSVNGGYSSSSSKRRRHYQTRYSSNDELSGIGSTASKTHRSHGGGHGNGGPSSDNESNLSEKDYDTLNEIIMGNEDGGVSLVLTEKANTPRQSSRSSHKQFTGLQGLKPEELNDDLALLRKAVKKEK